MRDARLTPTITGIPPFRGTPSIQMSVDLD
jgi:hypothetical protein